MEMHTILFVDDEEGMRDMFKRIFNNDGYKVLTAASGEEAIQVAREYNPGAIVLDYHMPGIDGIETMRRIKKIRNDSVFIMVSAMMDRDDIRMAEKNGARYCMSKPFNIDELKGVIKEALRGN